MDCFEVEVGCCKQGPNITIELLDESVEGVLISRIPSTGNVDYCPEQGRVGLEALVWVCLSENRDVWVEALKISNPCLTP